MKKHIHLISVALLVATALICISCGGLASARKGTGTYTFTITSELAENIARAANNGNLAIKVTVKSTDGTTYTPQPIQKAATVSSHDVDTVKAALTGMPFDFENVPFDVEMSLSVEITVDDVPRFSTLAQTFTLTKDGASTIAAKLYATLDTPIVLVDDTDDAYFRMAEITKDANGYLNIPDTPIDENLSEEELYCVDSSGTIYHTDEVEIEEDVDQYCIFTYPLSGPSTQCPVTFEGFSDSDTVFFGLCYDPIKNKVITIILAGNDETYSYDAYCYQFTPGTLPTTLTLTPTTAGVTKLAKNPYFDDLSEADFPIVLYAFNGRLYSLLSLDMSYYIPDSDDEDGIDDSELFPSITLRVQSLSDGKWIKDATVTIPDTHEQATNKDYTFNDMYVDESGVYVLFHQYEMWSQTPVDGKITFTDTDSVPTASDNAFFDRGGLIKLNAETLATERVFGVPGTKTSVDNLPIRLYYNSKHYPVAYFDSDLTTPVGNKTIPVTFSVAESQQTTFTNPQKIVAIKPKKLIIMDSGNFMYSSGDFTANARDCNDGYSDQNFVSTSSGPYTLKESRLVEVNLEDFTTSILAEIPGDFASYDITPGFYLRYYKSLDQMTYYSTGLNSCGFYLDNARDPSIRTWDLHPIDYGFKTFDGGSSYLEVSVALGTVEQ